MFRQYDIFCGTNTLNECWIALKAFFQKSKIKKYEKRAAKVMGCKYAISFGAGRHALYAILKSLGIGEGDEVIVQAFTCVVVPNAVLYTGAVPVYVDINLETFNMDVRQIRHKVRLGVTKAIIIQHTFGRAAEIGPIREVADHYNLALIEDCAHSVGVKHFGRPVGSFGVAGFYSSDHTKMISTGTGGMAFMNDAKMLKMMCIRREKVSLLKSSQMLFTFIVEVFLTHPRYYRVTKYVKKGLNRLHLFYFHRDENSKDRPKNYPVSLSKVQAAIGLSQLGKLEENLQHRIKLVDEPLLMYPLLVDDPVGFVKAMSKWFVIQRWFCSPVFGCKDLERVGYEKGSCPNAEYAAERIVNLPIHPRVGS